MQACEDVGIEAYIAQPQRGSAVRDGLFQEHTSVPCSRKQRPSGLKR
jgi:hypothetical protein